MLGFRVQGFLNYGMSMIRILVFGVSEFRSPYLWKVPCDFSIVFSAYGAKKGRI